MPNPADTIPFPTKTQTWDLNSSADGNDIDDEYDQSYANENDLDGRIQGIADFLPFKNFIQFTTSQTWVVPADVYKVYAEVGGGGGGGAGNNSSGGIVTSGGGGGSGAVRAKVFNVTPSENIPLVIGAGGAGGAGALPGGASGGNGGQSTLTAAGSGGAIVAGGGNGGQSTVLAPVGGLTNPGSNGILMHLQIGGGGTPSQVTGSLLVGGGKGGGISGADGQVDGNGALGGLSAGGQGGGIHTGVPVARNGGAGSIGYVRIWY